VLTPAAQSAGLLHAAGWRAVVVPPTATPAAFYRALATALELPGWFGANLDALWDSLNDLAQPTAVVLDRWQVFARSQPATWHRVLGVLRERTQQPPAFAVMLS